MNQNKSAEWTKTYRIIFRLFFIYLVLYLLFMEGFLIPKFSFLKHVQAPFAYVSKALVGFVISTFFQGNSSIEGYVQITCYFTIAIIITIVWSVLDKRKSYPALFKYLHTCARYYLAFVLLSYGIWKLTLAQFPSPWPSLLTVPLGSLRPFILFWNFMGAAESYQFFSGLMETIPAILLLFRRTSTLGVLITIGTLTNVLMLNISYEVFIIPFLLHLILIAIFILSHELKRLYKIFIVHKTQPLPIVHVTIGQNRYRWVRYALKFILIAYVLFTAIKEINEVVAARFGNLSFYSLHGIYNVKEFYRNQQSIPPLTTDPTRWHKLAIDGIGGASVVFTNDSSEYYYNVKVDTTAQILEFCNDSTTKNKVHYTLSKPDEYVFEGTYKKDSIKVVATKVDLTKLPLLKNRNKVKWTW